MVAVRRPDVRSVVTRPPVYIPPAPKKTRRRFWRSLTILVVLALITAFAVIWVTRETAEPQPTTSPTTEPSVGPSVTPTTNPTTSPTVSPTPPVQEGPNVNFFWGQDSDGNAKPAPRGVLLERHCYDTSDGEQCWALLSGDFVRSWRAKPGEEIEYRGLMIRPWYISFDIGRGIIATFFWSTGTKEEGPTNVAIWKLTTRLLEEDPTISSGGYGEGMVISIREAREFLEEGRRYPIDLPIEPGGTIPMDDPLAGFMGYNLALVQARLGQGPMPEGFGWMGEIQIPPDGRIRQN